MSEQENEAPWWLVAIIRYGLNALGGCMMLGLIWFVSVVICTVAALVSVGNFDDASMMGLAWGSTLGLLIGVVLGTGLTTLVMQLRA